MRRHKFIKPWVSFVQISLLVWYHVFAFAVVVDVVFKDFLFTHLRER